MFSLGKSARLPTANLGPQTELLCPHNVEKTKKKNTLRKRLGKERRKKKIKEVLQ